jgi:hypothetical protein
LEKDLKKVFEKEYELTFHWEEAARNKQVDVLVITDSFPKVINDTKMPGLKLPANLFLNQEVQQLDNFFNTWKINKASVQSKSISFIFEFFNSLR